MLAAVPGDTVEIAPKFVAINGKPLSNTATISRDSRGKHGDSSFMGTSTRSTRASMADRTFERSQLGFALLRICAAHFDSSRAETNRDLVIYV